MNHMLQTLTQMRKEQLGVSEHNNKLKAFF